LNISQKLQRAGAGAHSIAAKYDEGQGLTARPVHDRFGLKHVPAKWNPVRQGEPLFADKDMRQLWNLRRARPTGCSYLAGPTGRAKTGTRNKFG
jgi:hypothetical protein